MKFNDEQQKVADAILQGKSVAVLAEAGRGKTYVLKNVLPKLKNVMIVAPTGSAAVNIGLGATTIHRAFGLNPTIQDPTRFSTKPKPTITNVLKRVKVLVVEEVGACRRDLFEAMDHKLRQAKDVDEPFGGCQVILLGDVLQTVPILSKNEKSFYDRLFDSVWFFTSKSFQNFETFTLLKNERNSDERQNRIMQSVRVKDSNCELALDRLWEESTPYTPDENNIVLCQFNKDADTVNSVAYERNPNPEHCYFSVDTGNSADLNSVPVPAKLYLKKGLKVMLISNDEDGNYINGDLGKITSCEDGFVLVELDRTGKTVVVPPFRYDILTYKVKGKGITTKVLASRRQLPIKLGYACSLHKAQGRTLDSAVIDMGNLPEHFTMPSVFYVGITRVRDTTKLSFVRKPKLSDVKVDKTAIEFYKSIGG